MYKTSEYVKRVEKRLLTRLLAVWTGLEPATSAVTGRHSNQLNYQTKYLIKWWFRAESNHRHEDFQSSALPTELRNHHLAVWTGLEPATSAVTGRHSNQLNYQTNNNKNGGD